MNDLAPILQQARAFIEHNVPVEMLQRTVALSILALIIGIGLSVLGAKMAKPALTTALALVGAAFGVAFTQLAGYSCMPGPVVGGAVVDGVSWQAIFWLPWKISTRSTYTIP